MSLHPNMVTRTPQGWKKPQEEKTQVEQVEKLYAQFFLDTLYTLNPIPAHKSHAWSLQALL